jgi:deoxycytidine triphosphate deaminase
VTLLQPKPNTFSDSVSETSEETCADPGWKVGDRLTIGKIVTHKGEIVTSLVLEPQGIAHLISAERVRLPHDVCGFAHVLTGKCNQGLLTLNIGLIDPGWDNYVSTAILNFSSERQLLQEKQEFMRLTYHRVTFDEGANQASMKPYDNMSGAAYLSSVRMRAVSNFGKHFLNIRRLVGEASERETGRLRDAMLRYLPIGAFSLAFFALLVTIGIAVTARLSERPSKDNYQEIVARLSVLEQIVIQSQALRTSSGKSDTATPKPTPPDTKR